jgi:hypothetical protein
LLGEQEEDVRLFFFVIGEMAQHIIYPLASEQYSQRVEKSIVVFDVGNVSLMKTYFDLKPIIKISNQVMNNYYPETLHTLFIVNAGFFFRGVWNMAKVMLDKATQKKINILSDNGFAKLSQLMDPEDIPEFLGGSNTQKIWDMPGIFHEKYFEHFHEGRFITDRNREALRVYYQTDTEYLVRPLQEEGLGEETQVVVPLVQERIKEAKGDGLEVKDSESAREVSRVSGSNARVFGSERVPIDSLYVFDTEVDLDDPERGGSRMVQHRASKMSQGLKPFKFED